MIAFLKKFINTSIGTVGVEALDTKIDRSEGKIDTVDTVVDTINTNVGSNADSASATGSVHAKLKDIEIKMTHDLFNVAVLNNISLNNTTYFTILSYNGAGKAISTGGLCTINSAINFKITIDNQVSVINGASDLGILATFDGTGGNTYWKLDLNTPFSTNFKVEVQNTSGDGRAFDGYASYLT